MALDGFTLTVCSLGARTCFVLVFLAAWLGDRHDRYLLDWGLGVVLASAGFLVTLAHPYGDYFTAPTGFIVYSLVGSAFACGWRGIARFDGRRPPRTRALLLALAPGLIYAGLLAAGCPPEVSFAGTFAGLAFGGLVMTTQLLRRPAGRRLASRDLAAVATLLYVASFVFAAGLSLGEDETTTGLSSDVLALAADQFAGLLLNISLLGLAGERARAHLEDQVARDMLTGALNRVGILAAAEALLESRSRPEEIAVIAADLDHFKQINDRYGHETGDAVLVEFARRAGALVERRGGLLARYGGEEFVALLPAAGRLSARALAEELRVAVSSRPFPGLAAGDRVTVSVGVAVIAPDEQHIAPAMRRADAALYAAKNAGRDRVVA